MKTAAFFAALLITLASCSSESRTHSRCRYVTQDMHEYQLDIDNGTGYTLYDGLRLVGTVKTGAQLDSLIFADNL